MRETACVSRGKTTASGWWLANHLSPEYSASRRLSKMISFGRRSFRSDRSHGVECLIEFSPEKNIPQSTFRNPQRAAP
jgi:hypothetical protein